jgi:hypothetical protein
VAAIVAATALFFALSGEDAAVDTAGARPESPQPPASVAERPQAAPAKPKARPAPTVHRIVVRKGKGVGGVKRLEYRRGERVRFSVRADATDEVHVHGFDIEKAVPANRPVRFAFPADIEGVFEVELHSGHTKIAELRVRP